MATKCPYKYAFCTDKYGVLYGHMSCFVRTFALFVRTFFLTVRTFCTNIYLMRTYKVTFRCTAEEFGAYQQLARSRPLSKIIRDFLDAEVERRPKPQPGFLAEIAAEKKKLGLE